MVILRTHDIMIFGGMNGKLASKRFFWKWISCTEGENVETSIPNSRERLWLNYFVFDCFIFFFQPKKISYIFDWVVINFSFGLKRFFTSLIMLSSLFFVLSLKERSLPQKFCLSLFLEHFAVSIVASL